MAKKKRIIPVLFVLYCAVMLYLLLCRANASKTIPYTDQLITRLNLIPFQTLRQQFYFLSLRDNPVLVRHAVINLVGNVVMFIPLGLFLPTLWPRLRTLWKVLLRCAMAIALVEITQALLLTGWCDIDDLLLNLLGASIGYGIFRKIHPE